MVPSRPCAITLLLVAAAAAAAVPGAGSPGAELPAAPAAVRLPTGAVTPRGWLLRQLVIQAEGLSGHLSKFWPAVMNSAWFGGRWGNYSDADGRNNSCGAAPCPFVTKQGLTQSDLLHQEASYWLNGFTPLAYLLKNAGVTRLPPRGPGLPPVEPLGSSVSGLVK